MTGSARRGLACGNSADTRLEREVAGAALGVPPDAFASRAEMVAHLERYRRDGRSRPRGVEVQPGARGEGSSSPLGRSDVGAQRGGCTGAYQRALPAGTDGLPTGRCSTPAGASAEPCRVERRCQTRDCDARVTACGGRGHAGPTCVGAETGSGTARRCPPEARPASSAAARRGQTPGVRPRRTCGRSGRRGALRRDDWPKPRGGRYGLVGERCARAGRFRERDSPALEARSIGRGNGVVVRWGEGGGGGGSSLLCGVGGDAGGAIARHLATDGAGAAGPNGPGPTT